MAKHLNDILKQASDIIKGVRPSTTEPLSTGTDPGVDYKPKAGDESEFIAKHSVQKWDDVNGNDDKLFNASNIKRSNNHGKTNSAAKKDEFAPRGVTEEIVQNNDLQETTKHQIMGHFTKSPSTEIHLIHGRKDKVTKKTTRDVHVVSKDGKSERILAGVNPNWDHEKIKQHLSDTHKDKFAAAGGINWKKTVTEEVEKLHEITIEDVPPHAKPHAKQLARLAAHVKNNGFTHQSSKKKAGGLLDTAHIETVYKGPKASEVKLQTYNHPTEPYTVAMVKGHSDKKSTRYFISHSDHNGHASVIRQHIASGVKPKKPSIKEEALDEETFVIRHKKTRKVLSTHDTYAGAKDEHNGLSDKHEYGVYTRIKGKPKSFKTNEEVEALDELTGKGSLPSIQKHYRDERNAHSDAGEHDKAKEANKKASRAHVMDVHHKTSKGLNDVTKEILTAKGLADKYKRVKHVYKGPKFKDQPNEEVNLDEAMHLSDKHTVYHKDDSKKFASEYTKAHKGDHRNTGPTESDHKHSEAFHSTYDTKHIRNGFAGSGTTLYTHKKTGETFHVTREHNGKKGFYGMNHFVDKFNPEHKEGTE